MEQSTSSETQLTGADGKTHDVTIRVRGVVEMASYDSGIADGDVYIGGMATSEWNPFFLETSDPFQRYWLNTLGHGDLFTRSMDYEYTIPLADGATLHLEGGSGDDSCGLFNHDDNGIPIVVPGIEPRGVPFDGQFVQVDIVALSPQ